MEQLMLFAGDTHANPLALPGSDKARKMTVISGQKLLGSWTNTGPLGSLERMLLATSAWVSTTCFLTWKQKATPQGHLLFQLAPSMLNTDEIESGLWLTPTKVMTLEDPQKMRARAEKNGYRNGTSIGYLHSQVVYKPLYPTPTKTDSMPLSPMTAWRKENGMDRPSGAKIGSSLKWQPEIIKEAGLWPTPQASDNRDRGGPNNPSVQRRKAIGKQISLSQTQNGQLNPMWVEWLMGFPMGWTELPPSETQ